MAIGAGWSIKISKQGVYMENTSKILSFKKHHPQSLILMLIVIMSVMDII